MVALIEERDGQIEQLEKLLDGYQKAGLPLTDGTTADPSATEKIISVSHLQQWYDWLQE